MKRELKLPVCPAIGCVRRTKEILCRVHKPMLSKDNQAYLRKLRRNLRADPYLYEEQWNRAWRRVLSMIAAKEGRPLVSMLVSAS